MGTRQWGPDLLRGVVLHIEEGKAQVTLPRGGRAWVKDEEFLVGQKVYTVVYGGESVRAIDRYLWDEIIQGGSNREYEDAILTLTMKGVINNDTIGAGEGEISEILSLESDE